MTGEDLATVRFLFVYPVMLVFGTTWAIMFWRRWRRARYTSDIWSAALGSAVALWSALGLSALYIATLTPAGYGLVTSAMFTVGAVIVCIVIVAGVVVILGSQWQRLARHDETE